MSGSRVIPLSTSSKVNTKLKEGPNPEKEGPTPKEGHAPNMDGANSPRWKGQPPEQEGPNPVKERSALEKKRTNP